MEGRHSSMDTKVRDEDTSWGKKVVVAHIGARDVRYCSSSYSPAASHFLAAEIAAEKLEPSGYSAEARALDSSADTKPVETCLAVAEAFCSLAVGPEILEMLRWTWLWASAKFLVVLSAPLMGNLLDSYLVVLYPVIPEFANFLRSPVAAATYQK